MAPRKLGKIAVWLTGLAFIGVSTCGVWMGLLGLRNWSAILPLYGMVFVSAPIALLAIVLSLVATTRQRAKPAFGLILFNVALIAGPWIWLGIVT